ncbi:MAG: hypothetical protein E6H75_14360 [Betaproteobacteria bacterium]|nr:MAG: hypothetical protein E6H75_14360 [Betaproteobacteria bacterium]
MPTPASSPTARPARAAPPTSPPSTSSSRPAPTSCTCPTKGSGRCSPTSSPDSGRLRALAVSGLKRLESLPQIPTLDESGVKGFDASGWYGIVAPAGTPRGIVTRLNAEIRRIMQTPDLRARLDNEGAIPAPGSPEEFAAFIQSEIARWGAVLRRAGIQPQ